MKALSVRQPWVYSIFHLGKDIENRTRRTHYRGRIAIQASLRFDQYDLVTVRAILEELDRPRFDMPYPVKVEGRPDPRFPRGAIVGTVDLIDCVEDTDSKWFLGPIVYDANGKAKKNYGWRLSEPKLFDHPIPYKGVLGLFDVPDAIFARAA